MEFSRFVVAVVVIVTFGAGLYSTIGEAFHGVIWRGGFSWRGMCIYTHTYKCVCSPSPEKDARYPALSLSALILGDGLSCRTQS